MTTIYAALNVTEAYDLLTGEFTLSEETEPKIVFEAESAIARHIEEAILHVRIYDEKENVVCEESIYVSNKKLFEYKLPTVLPGTYFIAVAGEFRFAKTGSFQIKISFQTDKGEEILSKTLDVKIGKYKISILPGPSLEVIGDSDAVVNSLGEEVTFTLKPRWVHDWSTGLSASLIVKYFDTETGRPVYFTRPVNIGYWEPSVEAEILASRDNDYLFYDPMSGKHVPIGDNTLTIHLEGSTPYPVDEAKVTVETPPGIEVTGLFNLEGSGRVFEKTFTGLRAISPNIDDVFKPCQLSFKYYSLGMYVFKVTYSAKKNTYSGEREEHIIVKVHGFTYPLSMWVLHPTCVKPGSQVRIVVAIENRGSILGMCPYIPEDLEVNGDVPVFVFIHNGSPVLSKALIRAWKVV